MHKNYQSIKQSSLVLSMSLTLILAGCDNAVSEEVPMVVTPVKLSAVPDLSHSHTEHFIAKVDATDRAALSFQVAGEIAAMPVRMGSKVRKGDVLAYLDPTDFQLALDARQAEYDLARTQYQRARQLVERKLISTDSFDQTETYFKAAKVSLEQAKTDLEYTRMTAPFDGVVSLTMVESNQVVDAKQPVMNLLNHQVMDVIFTIPVSYVEKYGIDGIASSPLSVTMDSQRDLSIPAQFKEISTRPNPDTNSYTARVTIRTPKTLALLPDMTGQVNLQSEASVPNYRIAESAWVEKSTGKGVVWTFNESDQTVQKTSVTINDDGYVVAGLQQGDLVVEAGAQGLSQGQRVKAWTKEGGI